MISSRKVIRTLGASGWVTKRQKGSHCHLTHPDQPGKRVTVPHPEKDIPVGTLKSIEKQSGVKLLP
jgi:predicted RNA binding protein YcfA (HicA-like mRNA interferase family)